MAAVLLAAVLSVGGCAFDPSSVPLPGTTVSGQTYRIHIEFANALNLPARAKVASNGIQIGSLRSVRLVDPSESREGYVVADVDISESVKLPTNTSAQLRQATVLGDIYIALVTPSDGYDTPIPPDGTIGLAQSQPALQIEDAMAGIATFVGGGAFDQAQDIINRMNSVLPQDPNDTARISSVLGANFIDVSENLNQVDALLDGMTADAAVVSDNGPALSQLLTDEGAAQAVNSMNSLVATLDLFGALGTVAHSLEWLTPLFTSADAAAKAFVPLAFTSRPLDLTAPSNLNRLVDLIRDKLIPFVEHGPKLNIVDVNTTPTTAASPAVATDEQVARIIATLRMIGAVR
ncbi:MlaD family protein [Antrihabitans stalagmiti]|uniref:MlaD family protein n=1 Tax=Antrihabitans stalagmiti TaxID=2799499 RepID=UPI0027DB9C31|nr:MlaD family protein [Antrihabitans stalagmiti]